MARGDISLAVPVATPTAPVIHSIATAPETSTSARFSSDDTSVSTLENTPVWVEIAAIEANPYQPRRSFAVEEMADLVASVREHGIIQPILVRPRSGRPRMVSEKPYQLIAGERRWRAAQEAGLDKVPVVVRPVNDQQALELALIENVQRHDISVMDAARAYRRLGQEFDFSQEDIARRVGKSRPAISNTMRLLDLPEEAQKALEDGAISEGHGRAILLAPGEGARRAVFRRIVRDKLTVREAEEASRRALTTVGRCVTCATLLLIPANRKLSSAKLSSTELKALRVTEEELSKTLGTRVRIRPRAKGGQISIEYYSPDDLDHLLVPIA